MTKRAKPGPRPATPKRLPAGQRPDDHPEEFPTWRFQYLDADFPAATGWRNLGQEFLMQIVETLQHLERTPMNRLFLGHPGTKGSVTRYGAETLQVGLSNDAQRRLADRELEVDHLVRVRIQNMPRLYAFQGQANVLNLLWWDPEHVIYPTQR